MSKEAINLSEILNGDYIQRKPKVYKHYYSNIDNDDKLLLLQEAFEKLKGFEIFCEKPDNYYITLSACISLLRSYMRRHWNLMTLLNNKDDVRMILGANEYNRIYIDDIRICIYKFWVRV